MKPIDIIVAVLAVALVFFTVIRRLTKKKGKGGSDCGSGCSSCPFTGQCGREHEQDKQEE